MKPITQGTTTQKKNTGKASFVHTRIDPALKFKAEPILQAQGIKPSQAIAMLYTEIVRKGGLPFESSKIPNAATIKTLHDTDQDIGLTGPFKNPDDLFESLEQ